MAQMLGKYEIIELLGSGATADVYHARDTVLNREVALKILKSSLVADATSFDRFVLEARAAGNLFHDHIATVLDMGSIADKYFIALKFTPGRALDKVLAENKTLPWEQVYKMARQIGSALDYAHSQGFLHRDVKPSNIIMTRAGNFVLTDFGLARAMLSSGLTSTSGAILGTPPYIPPEIWNGKEPTAASDQYALACVIYQVITGQVLFDGGTPQEIITRHLIRGPEMNPALLQKSGPGIERVLRKALAANPADRFKNLADFNAALANPSQLPDPPAPRPAAAAANPPRPTPTPAAATPKKKGKRVLPILIGVLLLVCICGAAVVYTQGDRWFRPLSPQAPTLPVAEAITATLPAVEVPQQATPALNPTESSPAPVPPAAPASGSASTAPILPTSIPSPNDGPQGAEENLVGTGIKVEIQDGAEAKPGMGNLQIELRKGNGEPVSDQYVQVYSQKQSLSGDWVTDERVWSGSSDNAGLAKAELEAGKYIVSVDFQGYNSGTAADVKGQADVPVEVGKTTRISLTLGRLMLGFMRGDQSVIENQYIAVYTQKKDLAGNWVVDQRIASGNTDNTGTLLFNLTPGAYIVSTEFNGYNWGTATDCQGMVNVRVTPGQENRLITSLSRLIVGQVDAAGKPIENVYIQVLLQKKDASGNPAAGKRVEGRNTDNTGQVVFDITPGTYVILIDEQYLYNVKLEAGKITTSDGKNFEVR